MINNIELNNLTITYDGYPALQNVTATVERGDFIGIVGPNGSGKSTLLNALSGVISINQGSIKGFNANEVAYLPQNNQIDLSFPITVKELVLMGLWPRVSFYKSINRNNLEYKSAINAVKLQGLEERMINTLSGGQIRRALFARLLMQNREIILLDEPFNAIDHKTIEDLTKLIISWYHDKRTIIIISHDIDYVRKYCPKAMLLAREVIGLGITKEVLTDANLNLVQKIAENFDNNSPWYNRKAS